MPRTLILVPTQLERQVVGPLLEAAARIVLCGFGPVAAAARTARLLEVEEPARVVLVGIAGRLDDRLAVGRAYRFEQVACHGVGVGSGADFVAAEALGWLQWPGDPDDPESSTAIGDTLRCTTGAGPAAGGGLLLSGCSASAGPADVSVRRRLFPDASAEDMEGFAVAVACRLRGVPLDIVRGISNTAGDRDPSAWRVTAALEAAADLARAVLATSS